MCIWISEKIRPSFQWQLSDGSLLRRSLGGIKGKNTPSHVDTPKTAIRGSPSPGESGRVWEKRLLHCRVEAYIDRSRPQDEAGLLYGHTSEESMCALDLAWIRRILNSRKCLSPRVSDNCRVRDSHVSGLEFPARMTGTAVKVPHAKELMQARRRQQLSRHASLGCLWGNNIEKWKGFADSLGGLSASASNFRPRLRIYGGW